MRSARIAIDNNGDQHVIGFRHTFVGGQLSYVLDNEFPAPEGHTLNEAGFSRLWDSPWQGLWWTGFWTDVHVGYLVQNGQLQRVDEALRTWLVFRPSKINGNDIDEDDAIWVPIRRWDWHWSAHASRPQQQNDEPTDAYFMLAAQDGNPPSEVNLANLSPEQDLFPEWALVVRTPGG